MKSARATHKDPMHTLYATVCYIYILLCLYFICFISSLPYNLVQESQGNTSEFTSKLAAYTLGNESRDFFRNNPLPLEP
jgi:hypothetical protein